MLKPENGDPVVGSFGPFGHSANIYSIVKTVETGYDLEQHTSKGWRLIAVLQEQRVEQGMRQEINPGSNNNNYGQCNAIQLQTPHVVSHSVYLIGLDEHSSVKKVHDELDQALGDNHRLAEKYRELVGLQKLSDEAKETLRTDHSRAQNEVAHLREQCDLFSERIRKYENDIAKIRTAIGELKMKEIIGG